MINRDYVRKLGLEFIKDYTFDENHHSLIFKRNDICVIIDDNICENKNSNIFDYSKYCEMQNQYMAQFNKLYRFNYIDDNTYYEIKNWLNKTADSIRIDDIGGSFDTAHIDNTPLEKSFENLFIDAYGENATEYLKKKKKEYSISLNNGRNAFVDYVIETKNGNYAIEENGVHYHHPCLIGNKAYERQLEKQNTLNLYNFKVYRFSIQNLSFKDQTIDNIKTYLGNKENFLNSLVFKKQRKFELYEHQEKILKDIEKSRTKGIYTSLIVLPTGTGKSQIIIEDLKKLEKQNKIKNVLIMVPSTPLKIDWQNRVSFLNNKLKIEIKFYNSVFIEKIHLQKIIMTTYCLTKLITHKLQIAKKHCNILLQNI